MPFPTPPRRFSSPHRLRSALAAAVLALTLAPAGAVTLVGLTSANEIATFDSSAPGMASRVALSGLAAGDRLVGLDLRPSNNRLYGISLSQNLYTVDAATGVASFVAALSSPIVSGALGWGIDFNPVADYAGASSLRFVSSAGGNFAVNANTGVVGNLANPIAPGFTAVAYLNSVPLAGAGPASTALYYIDSNTDTLAIAPGAFNTPTISTVGPLGIDALRANGFEIGPDGMGYAALTTDLGSSLVSSLYRINLATGQATALGEFNGTLSGLALAPVPEPGTWALMVGGLALLLARRRQRGAEAAPSRC
jgi:hypothetical protein